MSDDPEKLQHELEAAQRALAEAEARCARHAAEHQEAATKEFEETCKKIEQAHQEWESALDVVEDPIFMHDKDFNILRCNRAYQQCAGIPFKQIIGQPYYEVFPKTHAPLPSCLRAMGKAAAEENEEEVLVGDTIYRSRSFSINDEQGDNLYSVHTLEDITERRQAEERLKLFRTLLDHSSDAIHVIDPVTLRFIDINETECRDLGYSREELLPMSAPDIDPAFNADARKMIEAQVRQSASVQFESVHRRKDGSTFPVEISLKSIELDKPYALTIVRDITERKRMEKELRESEARYRRIAEGLTDYQYTVRFENGRPVETTQSPACVTVTGYTAEEYAANPHLWIQMVVPEDREPVMQHVREILAGKDVSPIEHRITRKNGETRWISDTTILFRDASGRLLSYDGVIKDITERKTAEEDFHELFRAALQSLASAIEAKSPWTRGHSERVAGCAVSIGTQMGLADNALEKLRIAALLHDIGKIGTYDAILEKSGKLTDAEYETIKQHPGKGAEMLAPIRQLHDIIPWIRGHHERYDGTGYPDGLKGENIPLAARILAVADTFDSMTAERPYRTTPGKAKALEEIRRHAGTQFDPKVVEAFLRAEPPVALSYGVNIVSG